MMSLQICHQENLKLKKNKCHFRYMMVPFFGKIMSRCGVQPDHQKLHMLTHMQLPYDKTFQSFVVVMNYLEKFSLSNADVCESLRKVMSGKSECI